MSFFDRQGIPEVLLWDPDGHRPNDAISEDPAANQSNDTESISDEGSGSDLVDDLKMLIDYSFISISKDGSSFSTHRLVQLAAHIWLKPQGKTEHYNGQFISSLDRIFPPLPEYENMDYCRLFYPHIKSAIQQKPKSYEFLQRWACTLQKGALYAQDADNYRDSIEMAFNAKDPLQKLLGADHPETPP